MFIAMNRFQVKRGHEEEFEEIWRQRESKLAGTPGFLEFRMLRGPQTEDYTLYASHSVWQDEAAFLAWTRSEQFRAAHRGAGESRPHYLGPPEFEGFTSVDGV